MPLDPAPNTPGLSAQLEDSGSQGGGPTPVCPLSTALDTTSIAAETNTETPTTAAAEGATADRCEPPPPQMPATRSAAPRRTAALRHSISALPHATVLPQSPDHAPAAMPNPCSAPPDTSRALQQQKAADVMSQSAEVADLQGWSGRHSLVRRPATAGQSKSRAALHDGAFGAKAGRPQTATAAGRGWPAGRAVSPNSR